MIRRQPTTIGSARERTREDARARGRTRATTRPWTRERSTRADATRGDGEEETKTMRRLERLFD
jgi:hypothetical protein